MIRASMELAQRAKTTIEQNAMLHAIDESTKNRQVHSADENGNK